MALWNTIVYKPEWLSMEDIDLYAKRMDGDMDITIVESFFETQLKEVLTKSDKEILEFMDKYDTKNEWIEKRDILDYTSGTLTKEEMEDLKSRAYDVEYMSEILVENMTLFCEDKTILQNFKRDLIVYKGIK